MTEMSVIALQSSADDFAHPSIPPEGSTTAQGEGSRSVYGAVPHSPKIGTERKCNLPSCQKPFTQRSTSGEARFCCAAHKNEYWKMAARIGEQVLRGELSVSGVSQSKSVLAILRNAEGRWVTVKNALPFIIARDAVKALRSRGHVIPSRRRWNDILGKTEYQYRLVKDADARSGE